MSDSSASELRTFYAGRDVLVTGHTGFKGGWLTLWLARLGANVHGIALAPDQGEHNLFERADIGGRCRSTFGDVCDQETVSEVIRAARPSMVFHLAARALVQQGYEDPVRTIATNTLGTAIVLEAARQSPTVEAVVCVTTDKVYRNREWQWPYRETDEIGGDDAYSASKAGAELVARTYRRALRPKERKFALATARGGNVIGGGDWSPHRIVPDIVRALSSEQAVELRYPGATRPWQHVLDLCYGYLLLGRHLAVSDGEAAEEDSAWNFGPSVSEVISVEELTNLFLQVWGGCQKGIKRGTAAVHEANVLRLDPSKANSRLGWRPGLDAQTAINWTAEWYRRYLEGKAAAEITFDQISRFEQLLDQRGH